MVTPEAGRFRVGARDYLTQLFGGGNPYVRLGKLDSDNTLPDWSCSSRTRL